MVTVWLFSLLSLLLVIPLPVKGESLPNSIGPLKLTAFISGDEARREVERLHGIKLGFIEAYIGTYEQAEKKAKLWVSVYGSEAEASKEIEQMARRIRVSKKGPFWHFRVIPIEKVTVYFVVGTGQVHYFFQKGNKALWLAVEPSIAKETVRDLLRTFRKAP